VDDARPEATAVRFDDVLEAIGETPLVGLPSLSPKPGVRLWAKLEGQNPTGSLKDRIAKAMIEAGEASGELTPERTILEPTSGNTGIALAMIARRKGYRLTVVIPENASEERIQLLELFGAEIVLSPGDKGTNGSIEIARRLAQDERYFMPFQYGNPANPRAHEEGTGEEIVRDLPEVTHFVAGLGTGGTLTGVGHRLKRHDPNVKIVAAEPELGDLVYGLRSLEDGFVPPIFDETVLDRKFLVNAADSLRATRELTEREGVFAGISSGAVLHVGGGAVRARAAASSACSPTAGGSTCLPGLGARTARREDSRETTVVVGIRRPMVRRWRPRGDQHLRSCWAVSPWLAPSSTCCQETRSCTWDGSRLCSRRLEEIRTFALEESPKCHWRRGVSCRHLLRQVRVSRDRRRQRTASRWSGVDPDSPSCRSAQPSDRPDRPGPHRGGGATTPSRTAPTSARLGRSLSSNVGR
jgi:cysteine synthase B